MGKTTFKRFGKLAGYLNNQIGEKYHIALPDKEHFEYWAKSANFYSWRVQHGKQPESCGRPGSMCTSGVGRLGLRLRLAVGIARGLVKEIEAVEFIVESATFRCLRTYGKTLDFSDI